MENASKALLMAAEILLGVMILSIGVILFTTFSNFSADTAKKIDEKQLAEWNNKYLKYYGSALNDETGQDLPIKVTAHDIATVINCAAQNNLNYFGDNWRNDVTSNNYSMYYVQVGLQGISGYSEPHAEKYDKDIINNFLRDCSYDINSEDENRIRYFKCTKCEISDITKRVYYIKFTDYKNYN